MVQLNIFDTTGQFNTLEKIDANGDIQNTNNSMAYKILHWTDTNTGGIQKYLTMGVADTNQQYLQAGGDFIKGIYLFWEIFVKGAFLVSASLGQFAIIPKSILWIFNIPVAILYTLAIIQFVSGRQVED